MSPKKEVLVYPTIEKLKIHITILLHGNCTCFFPPQTLELRGVNLERSEVEAILGLNFDALLGSLPSMCLAEKNFAGETRDEGARVRSVRI